MVLKLDREFNDKGIRIVVIFGKLLQKYLGKKYLEVEDSVSINTIEHIDIIRRHLFGYPLYLILLSTDTNNEFEQSVVNNKTQNIVAIIHSESEFSTTQSLIKLRPSSFNRLVFKITDNKFLKVTQNITCQLIFRFKREFLCENENLYFLKSDEFIV